jgi:repressor LexA
MDGEGVELTPAAAKVLDYYRAHRKRHGRWPTLQEATAGLGFASDQAISYHLNKLADLGVVRKLRGARGIEIVGEDPDGFALPLVGKVAAGTPIACEEATDRRFDFRAKYDADGNFALTVAGDSLSGRGIFEGDTLIVAPRELVHHGELSVWRLAGPVYAVKEYDEVNQLLRPRNAAHKPIPLTARAEAEPVGVVIAVVRDLAGPPPRRGRGRA